ncbi:MAG TPA: ShlB/FhaC/HecB family hemolysin secretion/activation protein [Burkholderiales bacterium]
MLGSLARRILAAVAGVATSCALAQVPLPSPADPSRIEERAAPIRPAPGRPEAPQIPRPAPAAVPEALKGVKLTLDEVNFEGATAIPAERLKAEAARYLGREITGAEIFELANKLTVLYRNEGYLLSQVIVPPQSLSGRRLTLRVIEGYIANVHVEGHQSVRPTLVALGERIKASRPLHSGVLERYLLIANDLAGVQLRSVLTPSQATGAADLTLIATLKRVEGYVSLDNYGSKYLGPGQLNASVAANRLIGNDQLRFSGTTTGNDELNYGQIAYSNVLSAEGLRLLLSASQASTRPGFVLEPFEVRGRAETYIVSAGYPLWRTRNGSVLGRAVFDARNTESDVLGVRVIEDRVQALRLGLTWLSLDRFDGSSALDIELSQGIGGTEQDDPLKSRVGADATTHKIVIDYERFQPFGSSFGLTLGFAAQWTDEPLLSTEQYALGGRRYGRAYEPAELVGDRAVAFRLEPAYLRRGGGWLRLAQLYAFYDVGQVYDEVETPGLKQSRSLASAGFGTRLGLAGNITAMLEAAWPLTRPVASYMAEGKGDDVRILGSLMVRF